MAGYPIRGKILTDETGSVGGSADGLPNVIIIKNTGNAIGYYQTVQGVSMSIAATGDSGDSITLVNNGGFAEIPLVATGTILEVTYYNQ